MPGTNYKLANIPIGSNDPIGTYHILFKKKKLMTNTTARKPGGVEWVGSVHS
jgi:hypothetical protein